MTLVATIAGAVAMLANFAVFFGGRNRNPLGIVGILLVTLLAPIAAMLVQMAISRRRESRRTAPAPSCPAAALARLRASAHRQSALPSTIPKQTRTPRLRICSLSIRCVVDLPASSRVIRPRRNVSRGLRGWPGDGQETKKPGLWA